MTSDQLRIINQLKTKVHSKLTLEYASHPHISPVSWLELTNAVFGLMKSSYYQTHNEFFNAPIIITVSLDKTGIGENIFKTDYLATLDESGKLSRCNFIEIDIKGNIVDETFSDVIEEFDELENISRSSTDYLFFRVQGNSIFTIGNGKIISSIADINGITSSYRFDNRLSTNEIDKILDRYKHEFEMTIPSSLYWQNKAERKLKRKPEKLLGYFFLTYLSNNISDGDVTSEAIVSGSDDRLDIRVLNLNNQKINIYEVKWIGRSDGTVEYLGEKAQKRANDGIEQLKIYLKNEAQCENAVLVLYDARFETECEDINWLEEPTWNYKIYKPPFILPLKSETASASATKITEQKFKNQKNAPKK